MSQSTEPRPVAETPAADSSRRLYEAEVALHIARQSGVDAWVMAASERLHEALVRHLSTRP